MNSNIRSVIRLKSPSIKLLWLLIYNLYATGRFLYPRAFRGAYGVLFLDLSSLATQD